MTGRPILTAAQMREAEAGAIAAGTAVETLMERAGIAAAEAIWRFAGPLPALVLCGPSNNGGDGYVVARELAARGVEVRVAAAGEPRSEAARKARLSWNGPVEALAEAAPAPLLVDALFGTGLTRGLEEPLSARLNDLATQARVRVAIDLPSGVATDDGAILSPVLDFDLTITFQTLKPSHLLQPAARHLGRIVVADIGIAAASDLREIARPRLGAPGPDDHKYRRGYVLVFGGEMPGAAGLAASAALRSGAGSVRLVTETPISTLPLSVMQGAGDVETLLAEKRIGALLIGPGLIPGPESQALLERCLAADHPLILDAGAISLLAELGPDALRGRTEPAILTPHPGEFARLFGTLPGDKVAQAREAARLSGAIIISKGADSVVAAPDGRAAISADASNWLATAGSGDVLAGTVAAMRAGGLEGFEAACAGVWLHGRAAQIAGPGLIADDLPEGLRAALLECL